MNPTDYLESVIDRISEDSLISRSKIIREYSNPKKAHIRARLTFANNSYLEFYEYVEQMEDGEINIKTYSYHWADEGDRLIRRWDNTKHFPKLDNYPHHVHIGGSDGATPGKPVNIFEVLDEIASAIKK